MPKGNIFESWVEIFKGGKQTDSEGVTTDFTEDDVESLIANHEPAPCVIGHPTDTSPAYGWTDTLKREGLKLYSKYSNLNTDFVEAVNNKSFPNRSVRLRKVDNGYKIVHVGWLGGVAPAIKGLGPAFSEYKDEGMDFNSSWETGWSIERIGNAFRGLRDWMIEEKGLEVADKVIPAWEVDSIKDAGKNIQTEPVTDPDKTNSLFKEKPDMADKIYSDAEIAALKQTAADDAKAEVESEFSAKLDTANAAIAATAQADRDQRIATRIEGWKSEGKVTKANETGLKAFMQVIASDEKEFEFSEANGTKKQKPEDWFCEFMKNQKPVIKLGDMKANEDVASTQPSKAEIHAYMDKHDCGAADAVYALSDKEGED